MLLRHAVARTKESSERWSAYHAAQGGAGDPVRPLLVVQVPNRPSTELLADAVRTVLDEWPELGVENIAHVFGERTPLVIGADEVAYVAPEDAENEHKRLLEWEKQWLTGLELPFQVIDVASGDLGASASRKYDCEAWIPTQGKYRELTSASNCDSFQARRLSVRLRDGKKVQPLATLNGTLCAVPRTIVAILENHQQADGSVYVPPVLRPYLGGREVLEPVAK